jgi:hypothetical protein
MSPTVLRIARAVAVVLGLASAAGAQAASAATRFVDDDHVQCPFAGFRSISAALAVAHPGDAIRVCPGTYVEQVRMATPRVSVIGLTGDRSQAILRPPNPLVGSLGALVEMSAPGTTLSAVTLQGKAPPLSQCRFGHRFTGVWIHHPPGPFGQASIVDNVDMRQITHANCRGFDDVGVQIGGPAGGTRAIVRNSRYMSDSNGILVKPNSQASVLDNVIAHPPDRGPIAGFLFGISARGADVDIERNIISGFSLLRFGNAPTGLELESAHGTVGGGPGAGNTIRENGIGLQVMQSTDLTVSFNRVTRNRRWGIFVSTLPSRVDFVHNVVTNNWQGPPEPGQGIVDCLDDTLVPPPFGSENTWTDDIGGSSFPAGICTPRA